MNELFDDLFVDTDEFPTKTELNVVNSLKMGVGFEKIRRDFPISAQDTYFQLAHKGTIGIFTTFDSIFFFAKGSHQSRSITVEFQAYFPKMEKKSGGMQCIDQDEINKVAYCRGFISRWIFKQSEINNDEHRRFLTIYTSRVTYTMSIPHFMIDQFQKEIDKTGMEYQILTPEYTTAHCPYCRHEFSAREAEETVTCPNCKESVLVRS